MGNSTSLPPPPIRTPVLDQNGLMTSPWVAWLQKLYQRNGGGTAATNADLEALEALDGNGLHGVRNSLSEVRDDVLGLETNNVSINPLIARLDSLAVLLETIQIQQEVNNTVDLSEKNQTTNVTVDFSTNTHKKEQDTFDLTEPTKVHRFVDETAMLLFYSANKYSLPRIINGDHTFTGSMSFTGVVAFSAGVTFSSTISVIDNNFTIIGSGDPTRIVRFEVDTYVTAGNTRVVTFPDADIVVSGSASPLTATRVPYVAASNGLLTDSANFVYVAGTGLDVKDTTNNLSTTTGSGHFKGSLGWEGYGNCGSQMGVLNIASVDHGFRVGNGAALTGATGTVQYAGYFDVTPTSSATSGLFAGYFRARSAAASYTQANTIGVRIATAIKGAGSTQTTCYGLYVEAQTTGATNYAIFTAGGGLFKISDTTDASALGTAGAVFLCGLSVALKSWFGDTINVTEGKNISVGTVTGTSFGASTSQKVSLYGVTPVAQQASTVDIRTALINFGLFASGGANPLNLNGGTLTCDNMVISKASGSSIKVDTATPTYGFADLKGDITPKTTGAGTPVLSVFNGNIYGFKFVANDVIDLIFHVPHDYAPGTDIYIHVHWAHNGTAISGNVVFTHYSTYAKGHNQANYPAEITSTITYNTTDITTTPQYRHRIDEIALSTAGGSAALLNTTDLEPDGLIKMRMKVTTLPTITGGGLFIDTVDIHYQTTGVMGTKAKAPNFYT